MFIIEGILDLLKDGAFWVLDILKEGILWFLGEAFIFAFNHGDTILLTYPIWMFFLTALIHYWPQKIKP